MMNPHSDNALHRIVVSLGCAAIISLLAACGDSGDPDVQTPDTPSSQPDRPTGPAGSYDVPRALLHDDGSLTVQGVRIPVPRLWRWQETFTATRSANYSIPGEGDHEQAEFVVVAFEPGLGGAVSDNVERFRRQFLEPDVDEYPDAITETLNVDGMTVTTVDLTGRYAAPGLNWYADNQRMLTALIEGPDGLVVLRATGSAPTMTSNAAAFRRMVDGLTQAETNDVERP